MRELTQVQRVKAVLLRSADPDGVEYVARRLRELDDPMAVAAECLAIFDGDAPVAEHAVHQAMDYDALWVQDQWQKWPHQTTAATMPALLISHLLHMRDAQESGHAGK